MHLFPVRSIVGGDFVMATTIHTQILLLGFGIAVATGAVAVTISADLPRHRIALWPNALHDSLTH